MQPWAGLTLSGTMPETASSWQYPDLLLAQQAQQQAAAQYDLSARLNVLSLGLSHAAPVPAHGLASPAPAGGVVRPQYPAGPFRRAPLEVNYNKAITKKLASAVHYQQVD